MLVPFRHTALLQLTTQAPADILAADDGGCCPAHMQGSSLGATDLEKQQAQRGAMRSRGKKRFIAPDQGKCSTQTSCRERTFSIPGIARDEVNMRHKGRGEWGGHNYVVRAWKGVSSWNCLLGVEVVI